MDLIFNQIML